MDKLIRKKLEEQAEASYKEFSEKLNPGVEQVLGIRLPILRTMSKEIAKGDWKKALQGEDIYFEEIMLRGIVISDAVKDYDLALEYIRDFIPKVQSWAVCDSVFMGMKVLQKNREATWQFIQPYLNSGKEFEVRVALLIMMQHLLKCDEHGKKISRLRTVDIAALENENEIPGRYIGPVLDSLNREFPEGYYASMAASWTLAECVCIFPYTTMQFIKHNDMERLSFNKGLQKVVESRIPTEEVKSILKNYKK